MDEKQKRQRNYQFGKFAEDIAVAHYLTNGYTILERRWKLSNKVEIDIIAQKDNDIIFIEVKARKGDFTDPVESVDIKKKRQMQKGANAYLKKIKGSFEYRFDIFALTGDEKSYKTEILEDAFLVSLF